MSARITNAHLLAALTSLVEHVATMDSRLSAVEGQYATAAPVAQIASAPSARKAASKKTRTQAKAPAKVTLTEAERAAKAAAKEAATQAYKARKAALSPLNKALFGQGLTGDAWATRFNNVPAMEAALAMLTKAERKAALSALAPAL